MSVGWSGPDPTAQTEPGIDYELGTWFAPAAGITIDKVRVWAPGSSQALAGRKGRIWSTAGALLGEAAMPDSLTPGWSSHNLAAPVALAAGAAFWVTYSTITDYGAVVPGGFPRVSADGLVTAAVGGFHASPGSLPNSTGTAFFGVDVEYVQTAGNVAPVVGITVTPTGLAVTATLTVQDETPGSVTYRIEWGDGNVSSVATLGPHAHTYVTPGTYVVLVTATDPSGLTDAAATLVTVAPVFTGLNLADVADAVSARLDTIAGLRCYAYPASSVAPPAAIVSYPDAQVYDATYGRGMDRMTLPVVVVVGKASDRSARDRISEYTAGAGAKSVKQVLESGQYSAFDMVRVVRADFDVVQIAGTDYVAALFELDVAGRGRV